MNWTDRCATSAVSERVSQSAPDRRCVRRSISSRVRIRHCGTAAIARAVRWCGRRRYPAPGGQRRMHPPTPVVSRVSNRSRPCRRDGPCMLDAEIQRGPDVAENGVRAALCPGTACATQRDCWAAEVSASLKSAAGDKGVHLPSRCRAQPRRLASGSFTNGIRSSFGANHFRAFPETR